MNFFQTRAENQVNTTFCNAFARFSGKQVNYSAPAQADRPDNGRFDFGGHDPATPYAEAAINYHNHAMTFMMGIIMGCGFLLRP